MGILFISPKSKGISLFGPTEIKEYINTTLGIPNKRFPVILLIDNTKFKPVTNKPKEKKKEIVYLLGTIDYLRMQTIHDLIQKL